MSVVDMYDVVLSRRVYKKPMSYNVAYSELRRGSGEQFDPILVELVLQHKDEFQRIHERFDE